MKIKFRDVVAVACVGTLGYSLYKRNQVKKIMDNYDELHQGARVNRSIQEEKSAKVLSRKRKN